MENITEKVLQYQKTHEGLREIVSELAPRVYQFPRRKMGWDEDACGDFYVFVHSRLVRLLDRFHDQGKPFESYLYTVLSWQLRSFARGRKHDERAWNTNLHLETGDDAEVEKTGPSCQAERAVKSIPAEIVAVIRSDADRRNFLFLVLKCSRTVDAQNAAALAAAAGITSERLLELSTLLQEMRSRREARLDTFRCRRNKAFAQGRLLEEELKGEIEASRVAVLQAGLLRARRRMRLAMQRMARVGLAPTNREIAAVLGVPKGTVDSGLYWLKRKLASVYDPDNLRSA
jgi:RNA polymerase sigma factor (sigma-70 family)